MSKRRSVTLSAEAASILAESAKALGLITKRGSGKPTANVSALLGLIAGSIKNGDIDLSQFDVVPAHLTHRGAES